MKTRLFLISLISLISIKLSAQSIEIPIMERKFDLSSVVKSLAPCYIYTSKNKGLAGALYQLPWNFHDKSGTPYIELSPGIVWDTESGIGGPMATIGIRLDSLYTRVISNQWVRDHYTSPKAPYVKIGPFGGYISRLGLVWGGFAALSFGGK